MKLPRIALTVGLLWCAPAALPADDRPRSELLFQWLDTDGDGVLKRSEIPEGRIANFERFLQLGDRNSDGQLSREEFLIVIERISPRRGDTPFARPEGAPREGRPREGGPRPEGARDGGPGERGPRPDGPRDGGPRAEGSRDSGPRGGGPRGGGPRESGPREGGPRPEGFREGGPRPDGPRDGGFRDGGFRERGLREGGPREGGPRLAFLRILDTNDDGKLSAEELKAAATKFEQLDRNGDGLLDTFELIGEPPRWGGPRPEGDRRGGPQGPGRPGAGDRPREGDDRIPPVPKGTADEGQQFDVTEP